MGANAHVQPLVPVLRQTLLRHSLDRPGGRRAEASVSPNADRPLHAAALVYQAVFIEFATIDAAVTAAQPAVNASDAGLALADAAAAGFVQVYFHGCSICSVWQVCPTLLMPSPALQMSASKLSCHNQKPLQHKV
jgi:hypothetical protein